MSEHRVKVNGSFALNANQLVKKSDSIIIEPLPKEFVSRGGEKLSHAIQSFNPVSYTHLTLPTICSV